MSTSVREVPALKLAVTSRGWTFDVPTVLRSGIQGGVFIPLSHRRTADDLLIQQRLRMTQSSARLSNSESDMARLWRHGRRRGPARRGRYVALRQDQDGLRPADACLRRANDTSPGAGSVAFLEYPLGSADPDRLVFQRSQHPRYRVFADSTLGRLSTHRRHRDRGCRVGLHDRRASPVGGAQSCQGRRSAIFWTHGSTVASPD